MGLFMGDSGYNILSGIPVDGAVDSVNGKTGTVVLDATDVHALPDNTPLFSGNYNDLDNKPTIPSVVGLASETFVNNSINTLDSSLKAVAKTGSYNDLSNKPTIPVVPTNVGAFTNDVGYLTQHQSLTGYATEQWVENKNYLTEHQSLDNYYNKTQTDNLLNDKQPTISDLTTIRNNAAAGSAHSLLNGNPHNTTAQDVGARPNTWMPTAQDVGARPNTWMPTASDIGLGQVFKLKGSKTTTSDLPMSGNEIGDVWYVEAEEVGYIWLNKQGTNTWEQLGLPIDLSGYIQNPSTKTTGQVLTWDGSVWNAQDSQGGGTTFTVTIPALNWVQSGDYSTQTVPLVGLKATYKISPTVDCVLTNTDAELDTEILGAFGTISTITTGVDALSVRCIGESPTVDIPIIINVWE